MIKQNPHAIARDYARIMKHIEQQSGVSSWDFKTLNMSRPQMAAVLKQLCVDAIDTAFFDRWGAFPWQSMLAKNPLAVTVSEVLHKSYVPRRIWDWIPKTTLKLSSECDNE